MDTDHFFRARLDQMIDLRYPLAVLARRMPWAEIEAALAPLLAHRNRDGKLVADNDLFGSTAEVVGGSVSAAGQPRLPLRLQTIRERAERIRTQQRHHKNKLYALHAPEVECLARGKARHPYEFGVKAGIVVTHNRGLMIGARTFLGNPYDGHLLNAQLEQTAILLEDVGCQPQQVVVDLGFRGVDADNPGFDLIHRGKAKSLTRDQRRWLNRRRAVEPGIGHLKADHPMDRCWLQGAMGDSLHAMLCAAGYNLRWLLRAALRGWIKPLFCACSLPSGCGRKIARSAWCITSSPFDTPRGMQDEVRRAN